MDHLETSMVSNKERETIPVEYHNYLDVFDAENARRLPAFRQGYDFKIDLKPETQEAPWPKPSKLYQLTPDQKEEAKQQLLELDSFGMIQPSNSLFSPPLFFFPNNYVTPCIVTPY